MKILPVNLSSQPADKKEQTKIFPVIDSHVDLIYMMMRQAPEVQFCNLANNQITPQKLRQGNVRVVVSAFYCPDSFNGHLTAVSYLQTLWSYAKRNMQGLFTISTADELDMYYHSDIGSGALLLIENADALVDLNFADLKKYGFKGVGLTHAGKNRIGDGNSVKNPSGLTKKGRQLVSKINRLKFFIDVAHLSEPCFWETVDIFDGPLISSHTGFKRFCDLPRNLSDRQMQVLIKRRGIIGVTVNPEMLTINNQPATIIDVFRQIDWFVQKFGVNNVGIGSDFGGFDVVNQGLEHHGRFIGLIELFTRYGYPNDGIAKIMGGNWYRFYTALLRNAD